MSAAFNAIKRGTLGPSAGVIGAGGAAAGALLGSGGGEKEKGMWVPDGFMAVRTRFGRAVIKKNVAVVKEPGFRPHIPGTNANKWISTQDRVCSLGHVAIKRQGLLTAVHTEATWGIKSTPEDVHAAWLKVKAGELDQRFTSIFGNAFNIVMSCVPVDLIKEVQNKVPWDGEDRAELDELIAQKKAHVNRIKELTAEVAAEELATIGSEIRWLSIRADGPHPFTQIGEKSAAVAIVGEDGQLEGAGNDATVVPITGVAGA